ncbi:MAG: nucleotidyl transferase AbiEii/AbiGii toxin family protein [Lewinellaceae bacterium]|nr:nucleotidyl transferase AbiEii/AbiGii toxin family protein [Lewinellaceae bacterium]
MLHKEPDIILPETFELLQKLQKDEELRKFFLVGDTSLALQIGHRLSVDLDLFSLNHIETQSLTEYLQINYQFQLSSVGKNTIMGSIEGIKVDFLTHAYPLVREFVTEEGLRLASIEDIGAMKLNAIAHSGQRLKDFIDIFFILEQYSLNAILEAYQVKYSNSNPIVPLKALTYFDDLDAEEDFPLMKKKIQRKAMEKRLVAAVENPTKIFK